MINCNSLSLEYGTRHLYKNVQLNLLARNRYAVVGANGSGKSTFLKLLSGEEQPSSGAVDKPKLSTIGILKQDHFRYNDERVIDVVIDGKPALAEALKEKERILNKADDITDEELYRLAELEETIMAMDGYVADTQAEKILNGLGIPHAAHQGPLSALSGGYKLRVLLAQSLFQDPDILLLDEPTNHLDIVSITWLEDFLIEKYKGLLLFVSHDRQFIDNTATHILDVDYETITQYHGNYEKFLAKKEEVLAQFEAEISHKQGQIAHLQEFVDRFGAKASKAKQAQSRLKMIDRIELPDSKNTSRIQPHFAFTQHRPSGKQVLAVKKLEKAYGEKVLFKNLTFPINRGQKCAVIGANGIGKSTLLKILLNQLTADDGSFEWSETASIGYFATNHIDLETIDGLTEGLHKFPGTVICVSHNRYFVQNIATSLLVMTKHGVEMYQGTYQEYLDKMGHDYLLTA